VYDGPNCFADVVVALFSHFALSLDPMLMQRSSRPLSHCQGLWFDHVLEERSATLNIFGALAGCIRVRTTG
jgi:hypothetical protein